MRSKAGAVQHLIFLCLSAIVATTFLSVVKASTDPGDTYFTHISNTDLASLVYNEESPIVISTSSDGTVLAASGVIGEDDDTYDHIFKIVTFKTDENGGWESLGAPILNDESFDSFFAEDARADISLSGDGKKLAVSVVYKVRRPIVNILDSHGFVKVFQHDLVDATQNWTPFKTVYEGNAGSGGEEVGLKVSFDQNGEKLLVGEMYYDSDPSDHSDNSGKITVYDIAANSTISLPVPGGSEGNLVGASVAMARDGSCFVYGATGVPYSSPGAASIYCWNDTNDQWEAKASLVGEDMGDAFGGAVAISHTGKYVIVGGHKNDVEDTKTDAGHARVYRDVGGGTYQQMGGDINGDNGMISVGYYKVGDSFGFDVAISHNEASGRVRIVVGAPDNQEQGYYFGQASVFDWVDATGSWERVGENIYGSSSLASVGYSIAIDQNGNNIFVGSSSGTDGSTGIIQFKETEYSAAPSTSPSTSSAPSCAPVASFEGGYRIKTTYKDPRCITSASLEEGARVVMRPCVTPPGACEPANHLTETHKKQVWESTADGQIKLFAANYCLKRHSTYGLRLYECHTDAQFKFTFDEAKKAVETTEITVNGLPLAVGYDHRKLFGLVRLYKSGSLNPTRNKWVSIDP